MMAWNIYQEHQHPEGSGGVAKHSPTITPEEKSGSQDVVDSCFRFMASERHFRKRSLQFDDP